MKKDDRIYAGFPIEMDEHPKIIVLSDAAFRALFEATFYARRMLTDGFLDERIVLRRWGREVAEEMSSNDPERPTWVRVEEPLPGWVIHDFLKHHPSRAEVEARRATISEKRSIAGARGAASRWQRDGKRVANDGEQEQEQEQKQKPVSLVTEVKRLSDSEESNTGSLIPDDWRPNQQHIDKANALHLDVKREYTRFRSHAEMKQRRMKNWNAAFTNWLKQGAVMAQERQGHAPAQSRPNPQSKAALNAERFREEFGDEREGSMAALDSGFGS